MDSAFPAFVTLPHCQGVSMSFRWVGVVDFLPSLFLLDLSSSFLPSFSSLWLVGHLVPFVCLPDLGSHSSFATGICVVSSLFVLFFLSL